jgi:hypothetical protein
MSGKGSDGVENHRNPGPRKTVMTLIEGVTLGIAVLGAVSVGPVEMGIHA